MRPLLHLVGIFKDEAGNIAATLQSVREHIDGATILDTGSTDGTQEIIRRELAGVPLCLFEEPFVDFATTRNRVLELDLDPNAGMSYLSAFQIMNAVAKAPLQSPVFTLMLSGDETLANGDLLREYLEEHRDAKDGAYAIEMRAGEQHWPYPRVLRTDARWRYIGKVHENPYGPNDPKTERTGPLVPGVYIRHAVSDPVRRLRRIREYDLPVLTKEVEDENQSIEHRTRYMFFLADCHAALAAETPRAPGNAWISHQMMAMSLYWRYSELAGAGDHAFVDPLRAAFALFFFFHIAEKIGLFSPEELLGRLEALAAGDGSQIPEVHFVIARTAYRLDPRRSLFLAQESARAAARARANPTHLATDARIEWMSYKIAADSARLLGKLEQMRVLARQGIEAGGPPAAFADYLKESPCP